MNCGKTKYSSEQFALAHIEIIKRKPKRRKTPCAVYLCKCGSWHLTSKLDRKASTINKLKDDIANLNKQIQVITANNNKELLKQIIKEEQVKSLIATISKHNKTISMLRRDNAQLISKIVQLEIIKNQ